MMVGATAAASFLQANLKRKKKTGKKENHFEAKMKKFLRKNG